MDLLSSVNSDIIYSSFKLFIDNLLVLLPLHFRGRLRYSDFIRLRFIRNVDDFYCFGLFLPFLLLPHDHHCQDSDNNSDTDSHREWEQRRRRITWINWCSVSVRDTSVRDWCSCIQLCLSFNQALDGGCGASFWCNKIRSTMSQRMFHGENINNVPLFGAVHIAAMTLENLIRSGICVKTLQEVSTVTTN